MKIKHDSKKCDTRRNSKSGKRQAVAPSLQPRHLPRSRHRSISERHRPSLDQHLYGYQHQQAGNPKTVHKARRQAQGRKLRGKRPKHWLVYRTSDQWAAAVLAALVPLPLYIVQAWALDRHLQLYGLQCRFNAMPSSWSKEVEPVLRIYSSLLWVVPSAKIKECSSLGEVVDSWDPQELVEIFRTLYRHPCKVVLLEVLVEVEAAETQNKNGVNECNNCTSSTSRKPDSYVKNSSAQVLEAL